MKFKRTLLTSALLASVMTVQAETPSNEEIWKLLQEMKQQLAEVKKQNQQLKDENESLKHKVDSNEQAVRQANQTAEAVASATEEAVKSVSMNNSKNMIGGYGELHYNNLDNQHGTNDKDQIDFHRFVLFFGHEFNERLRFFSEVEIEHTVSEKDAPGAVELEQAYIQYDLNQKNRVSAGLFLMPVGFLNETHEPTTFYGVERNNVEKYIIPTTWFEGGAKVSGELSHGFAYDLALTSGMKASLADNYSVRNARQEMAEAEANNFAYTARLKWTGIPGIELGSAVNYQSDITQGTDPTAGDAYMLEAHAAINKGNFGLRTLYAAWHLSGDGPRSVGADKQKGWYIEPSYKITESIGLFTRYSMWDNQAGSSTDTEYRQWTMGMNWWLDPQVVVKFDYQNQSAPKSEAEFDGINLGLGYQF